MSAFGLSAPRLTVAVAACAALLAIGGPSALAAPATDDQGFVDSTARCATPDVAVAFGSTETARVAICKIPGGQYEYRGVRVRDGAKLIAPASRSGGGGYVAEDDGSTYAVTANSLVVSAGNRVVREEPWVFFRGLESSKAPTGTDTTNAPPTTTTPTTTTSTTATPTTPLPPPLPAEVGGKGR